MDLWYRVAVVAFLSSWLLLSLLTVSRVRWFNRRPRWDALKLLSSWGLFITSEGTHPSASPVLCRDRLQDGSLGPLRPIARGVMIWSWRGVIWRREWDAEVIMSRLVKQLRRESREAGAKVPRTATRGYRHLWHVVRACDEASGHAVARQFVILSTYGAHSGKPPARVLQSEFHTL